MKDFLEFLNFILIHSESLLGKVIFQDIDVKFQVRSYLKFGVYVLKHAFFPMDGHKYSYVKNLNHEPLATT